MEKKEYQKLVKTMEPKPKRVTHSILAFVSGGLIGSIGEVMRLLLINYYGLKASDASGIVLFLVIVLACFFTAFCDLDKLFIKYKAGLIVPITGFAHSIQSSALDYKKDGLITGLGSNFFKLAGSVILYGTISAFLLCVIKVVLYG